MRVRKASGCKRESSKGESADCIVPSLAVCIKRSDQRAYNDVALAYITKAIVMNKDAPPII